MFETLSPFPPDPILGISSAYAADPTASKIDVGVGVYRSEEGHTPVMQAVRIAEARVAATQTTKGYLSTAGNAAFNDAVMALVLGVDHPAVTDGRAVALQTPGGCGALRLAADLVYATKPGSVVAVSDPTWPNHAALIGGAGLDVVTYPYYSAATHTIRYGELLAAVTTLPRGSVVLLQPSCHNPTGADLDAAQWRELGDAMMRRELLPLLDLAYQGLGEGLTADVAALRHWCASFPRALVTVSCSKNFGLYRERTGAVIYVGQSAAEVHAVHTHLMMLARRIYSMPPDHGAAIVGTLWADAGLRSLWQGELESMRVRLNGLRVELAEEFARVMPGARFAHIATQRGMFSLLGLSPAEVVELRTQHHVYCAPDSRINIAGLSSARVGRLVAAVAEVLAHR